MHFGTPLVSELPRLSLVSAPHFATELQRVVRTTTHRSQTKKTGTRPVKRPREDCSVDSHFVRLLPTAYASNREPQNSYFALGNPDADNALGQKNEPHSWQSHEGRFDHESQ